MNSLTTSQRTELRRQFDRFCDPATGKIRQRELSQILKAIDVNISQFELQTLIQRLGLAAPSSSTSGLSAGAVDPNSIEIDFTGFATLMLTSTEDIVGEGAPGGSDLSDKDSLANIDAEVRAAFAAFDVNGDGRISLKDLTKVMRALGEPFSSHEVCVNRYDFTSMRQMFRALRPSSLYQTFTHLSLPYLSLYCLRPLHPPSHPTHRLLHHVAAACSWRRW